MAKPKKSMKANTKVALTTGQRDLFRESRHLSAKGQCDEMGWQHTQINIQRVYNLRKAYAKSGGHLKVADEATPFKVAKALLKRKGAFKILHTDSGRDRTEVALRPKKGRLFGMVLPTKKRCGVVLMSIEFPEMWIKPSESNQPLSRRSRWELERTINSGGLY